MYFNILGNTSLYGQTCIFQTWIGCLNNCHWIRFIIFRFRTYRCSTIGFRCEWFMSVIRNTFQIQKYLLLPIQQMRNTTNKYESKYNKYILNKKNVCVKFSRTYQFNKTIVTWTTYMYPSRLPQIFLGATLKVYGAPGNIQKNLTPLGPYFTEHKHNEIKTCLQYWTTRKIRVVRGLIGVTVPRFESWN